MCSCSHFCCVIFRISGFMYTYVMLIWLTNVCWVLPLAWQKHCLIEALPSKISIPSTFRFSPSIPPSNAIKKTLLLLLLVSLFFSLPFYFKLYKISTEFVALWLCGLFKYFRFQISGNKSWNLRSKILKK